MGSATSLLISASTSSAACKNSCFCTVAGGGNDAGGATLCASAPRARKSDIIMQAKNRFT